MIDGRYTPLPTFPVPLGVQDLTGRRIGCVEVLGLSDWQGAGKRPKRYWVTVCRCGLYRPLTEASLLAYESVHCVSCETGQCQRCGAVRRLSEGVCSKCALKVNSKPVPTVGAPADEQVPSKQGPIKRRWVQVVKSDPVDRTAALVTKSRRP